MNWLDIIFILVLLVGTGLGIVSGFIWQLARLLLLIISAYITFLVHSSIAQWLATTMSDPFLAKIIIYIFIFIIIYLILFFITWFIERSVTKVALKPVDRVFGGVFGFLKTALICGTIILGLIYYTYTISNIQQTLRNSWLSPYLLIYTRKVVFLMPRKYKSKLKHFVDQAKGKITLPDEAGKDNDKR